MKKLIFAVLALASVTACQKVAEGGNHNILKMEEGTHRYSDDVQGTVFKRDTALKAEHVTATTDSAAVKTATPATTESHESTVNSMSAPVNHSATETK